jgi:hypothetical protein
VWVDAGPTTFLFHICDAPVVVVWAEFAARKSEVYIAAVSFRLRRAPDIGFELLRCLGPKHEPYCFSGGEFPFPQNSVINAAFPGTLSRGHPQQGFVLAFACQPLTSELRRYLGLVAELSVFDEFGKVVGSTRFPIRLDAEEYGKRSSSRTRKGLFQPVDWDEQDLTLNVPVERTPPRSSDVRLSTTGGVGRTSRPNRRLR